MIYLVVVSILWAFSFGISKVYLAGVDAFFVAAARMALAFLVFLPFLRTKGLKGKNWARLMLIGAIQYGVMYQAYTYCFSILKAYEVAIFSVFTPLYVVMFDAIAQRQWSVRVFLCALLSVLGAAVIEYSPSNPVDLWKSFLLMQLANLAFAFGQVDYKYWRKAHPQTRDRDIFAVIYAGAFAFTLLSSAVFTDWSTLELRPSHYGALLYLGLGASGLGLFLWNVGATQTSAGALAILNNLLVPLGVVVSLLFFSEVKDLSLQNGLRLFIGTVFIALALFANERWAVPAEERKERSKCL